MELRDQDTEIGMPSPLVYNRDSSSKVSSAPVGESRRDHQSTTVHGDVIFNPPQALDQHQHPLLYNQLNPQQRIQNKPRRDLDTDPDPVPPPTATTGAIAIQVPIASRSNLTASGQPQAPPASSTAIAVASARYRECLKNHAANMGGHVMDGCGEFMPSGEEGTPEALKCAACECHRNFHRKEVDGEPQHALNSYYTYNNPNKYNTTQRNTILHHHQFPPQQQPFQHHHRYPYTSPPTAMYAPMMMNFGGGGGGGSSGGGPAESSSEDLNMFQSRTVGQTSMVPQISKKRFRSKFTQEQKDKMMEFADKLGWKMQKQDDQEVQNFCTEVGVKRQVFKVWMHNNKQGIKKKQV